VWGTMIFGTDTESPEVFDRVADFVLDNDIDIMTCGIETPAPGTRFYERLQADGRLFRNRFPEDWQYGTAHHLLYLLQSMPLDDSSAGLEPLYGRLYTAGVLGKRFARAREVRGTLAAASFAFRVTLDWQLVFRHLTQNAKALRDPGEYDRALWRYRQEHATAT